MSVSRALSYTIQKRSLKSRDSPNGSTGPCNGDHVDVNLYCSSYYYLRIRPYEI